MSRRTAALTLALATAAVLLWRWVRRQSEPAAERDTLGIPGKERGQLATDEELLSNIGYFDALAEEGANGNVY